MGGSLRPATEDTAREGSDHRREASPPRRGEVTDHRAAWPAVRRSNREELPPSSTSPGPVTQLRKQRTATSQPAARSGVTERTRASPLVWQTDIEPTHMERSARRLDPAPEHLLATLGRAKAVADLGTSLLPQVVALRLMDRQPELRRAPQQRTCREARPRGEPPGEAAARFRGDAPPRRGLPVGRHARR